MSATAHKTLFEVLGVRPEASDADVETAFAGFEIGSAAPVPSDVREAYRFLQDSGRRAWYVELLAACDRDELLHVAQPDFAQFKALCDLSQIIIFPKPDSANSYAVRRPGQAPPRWTGDCRPVGDPGPPIPTLSRRFWALFEAVFLLGAFRRATTGARIGLAILYCLVLAAGAYGIRWTSNEIALHRAADLAAAVRAGHATALEELTRMEAQAQAVDAEFTAVTGAGFDPVTGKSTKPRPEVDESILRHQTVREAWAAIESARVKPSELEGKKSTLTAIGSRIQCQTFIPDDRDRLDEVIQWIDRSSSKLAGQTRFIKHVKTIVEADQFDQTLQTSKMNGS